MCEIVGVMTIALAIKVDDGVVLAADSATTMLQTDSSGAVSVMNIYNNANKLFNLHKGLPLGALTWGLGNIGPASISTLAKDLRKRFDGPAGSPGALDASSYDMETVSQNVQQFLETEKYDPAFVGVQQPDRPYLGFLTVGYSSGADSPQLFELSLGATPTVRQEVLKDDTGVIWWGQPEAISRILNGFSLDTPQALLNIGMDAASVDPVMRGLRQQVSAQLTQSAMPIKDAIDLAEFLVYATVQFVRFAPGNPTVGGPIEIATVTKHEGFKWVARKHYYDRKLNPAHLGS